MQKAIKLSLMLSVLSGASAQAGPWAHSYFGATLGFNQTDITNTDISNYNGGGVTIEYPADTLNFGIHVGQNYDLSPNWYWGWELGAFNGPLDGEGQHAPFVGDPTRVDDSIASITSSGMLRAVGRLGFASSQQWMLYGLAGITATKVSAEFNDTNPTGAVAAHTSGGTDTLIAPTIGIGYEHRFAQSDEWIGHIEVTHTMYDDVLSSVSSGFQFEHEVKPMTSVRIGLSKMF